MKLYYKPGACSLASHIALTEIGARHDIEQVDTKAGKTENGNDFSKINPNGYVPVLELADGQTISEGAAVLQYIGDSAPASGLTPPSGTMERVRVQQYLNYVGSELHKSFGPLFAETPPEGAAKEAALKGIARRFDYIESLLSDGRDFLVGSSFTVADAYAFVVSNWANFTGIGLDAWPNVKAYVDRIAARPAVQTAMKAEGLI